MLFLFLKFIDMVRIVFIKICEIYGFISLIELIIIVINVRLYYELVLDVVY